MEKFASELKKLLKKHNIWVSGTLRVRDLKEFDEKTANCEVLDFLNYGYATDSQGPFIRFGINEKKSTIEHVFSASKLVVMDTDKLLRDGVKSPIDGSIHGNRAGYKDHLKRHGCVEIGNDFNNAKPRSEVRGDFNCREELTKATHQVMDKYEY